MNVSALILYHRCHKQKPGQTAPGYLFIFYHAYFPIQNYTKGPSHAFFRQPNRYLTTFIC